MRAQGVGNWGGGLCGFWLSGYFLSTPTLLSNLPERLSGDSRIPKNSSLHVLYQKVKGVLRNIVLDIE